MIFSLTLTLACAWAPALAAEKAAAPNSPKTKNWSEMAVGAMQSGVCSIPAWNPCIDIAQCKVTVPVIGEAVCICPKGFYGDGKKPDKGGKGCEDIDECTSRLDDCNRLTEQCVNTIGSFQCACLPGFEKLPKAQSCTDVDECASPRLNSCNQADQFCINTFGSYQCECMDRSKVIDEQTKECRPIDPCLDPPLSARPCPQLCTTVQGKALCSCFDGFILSPDGSNCLDVDECALLSPPCQTNPPGGGRCVNTEGSYYCECDEMQGWKPSFDKLSCVNRNECLEDPMPCGSLRVCCQDLQPPDKFVCLTPEAAWSRYNSQPNPERTAPLDPQETHPPTRADTQEMQDYEKLSIALMHLFKHVPPQTWNLPLNRDTPNPDPHSYPALENAALHRTPQPYGFPLYDDGHPLYDDGQNLAPRPYPPQPPLGPNRLIRSSDLYLPSSPVTQPRPEIQPNFPHRAPNPWLHPETHPSQFAPNLQPPLPQWKHNSLRHTNNPHPYGAFPFDADNPAPWTPTPAFPANPIDHNARITLNHYPYSPITATDKHPETANAFFARDLQQADSRTAKLDLYDHYDLPPSPDSNAPPATNLLRHINNLPLKLDSLHPNTKHTDKRTPKKRFVPWLRPQKPKSETMGCQSHNSEFSNLSKIARHETVDMSLCLELCSHDTNCWAISWNQITRRCSLYSKPASPEGKDHTVNFQHKHAEVSIWPGCTDSNDSRLIALMNAAKKSAPSAHRALQLSDWSPPPPFHPDNYPPASRQLDTSDAHLNFFNHSLTLGHHYTDLPAQSHPYPPFPLPSNSFDLPTPIPSPTPHLETLSSLPSPPPQYRHPLDAHAQGPGIDSHHPPLHALSHSPVANTYDAKTVPTDANREYDEVTGFAFPRTSRFMSSLTLFHPEDKCPPGFVYTADIIRQKKKESIKSAVVATLKSGAIDENGNNVPITSGAVTKAMSKNASETTNQINKLYSAVKEITNALATQADSSATPLAAGADDIWTARLQSLNIP